MIYEYDDERDYEAEAERAEIEADRAIDEAAEDLVRLHRIENHCDVETMERIARELEDLG